MAQSVHSCVAEPRQRNRWRPFGPAHVLLLGWFAVAAACGGPASEKDDDVDDTVSLRAAGARAGKLLGTAVDADALSNDVEYAGVLAREFDYVTPENAMKWERLAPSAETYTWEEADSIIDFALGHEQQVKGHTLVWHRQSPSWVNESLSPEELSTALKAHIETTLDRYRGRIRAWDVVNEAVDVNSQSGFTESVFYNTLGQSYIEDAFRWARAADPDVLLFYNEVGIERMGPKADFTYALMKDLLDRGVPIDGIGFQSHVSTHRYPSADDLRANIRRFAELGLSVNISEVDARTVLMPGDQDTRWHAQRLAFQQIVSVCVTEPACEAITFWGFTDKYSWINDDSPEPDDPLIFDRNYAVKPAYTGILDGLAGEAPRVGDNLVTNGNFNSGTEAWSVSGGILAVAQAQDRPGDAGCVTGREHEADGLRQTNLLPKLEQGGPLSFTAWVRLGQVAGTGPVEAALNVQTDDGETVPISLATGTANDGEWTRLSGYFGLGFEQVPTAIELVLYGPAADVDLCVTDVEVRPLSP